MPIPEILRDRLRLPVIGAPMFIVSTPRLVLAQCKAGIVGSFPALNARPASQLDDWLAQITEELAAFQRANPHLKVAPFAVNQIVHSSNNRLEEDVGLCVKHKVPIIITSLRPPAEVVAAVHGYGGIVFHDVINLRHAEKAAAQGVDGIIAVCAGAGGHAGIVEPVCPGQTNSRGLSGRHHPVRRHEQRRRCVGGASAGRGSGLSGNALHCDGGGQRAARVQANAHRQRRRGHRLHVACSAV